MATPEVQTPPLPSGTPTGDGAAHGGSPSGAVLPGGLTPYERYVLTFPEGMKGDLIGGEAVIEMSITLVHERIVAFLIQLLGLYAQSRGLGEVLGSRTTMKVDDENGYEPDVLFVRAGREAAYGLRDIHEPVDVAVEVVSPTSGRRDRETKFEGYERLGVPEYWLIDPTRSEAAFYRLDAEGLYRAIPLGADGLFESVVVPGFRLDPQALFADPLPAVLPLLQAMLTAAGGEGAA